MRKRMLSRVSFAITGGLVLVIACGDDTGTTPILGSSAGTGASPATGGVGGVTGGTGGTAGGFSGSTSKAGGTGIAGSSTTGGTAGTGGTGGTSGTAGTMNDDEAECGNQPMPGDSCTGSGQCDGSRRCSCTNGMVTGQTCGQQFQQQGDTAGAGGMAPGGIDCGASPSNGDGCPAPGVCRSGMGCQCAAGLLTVYGCMDEGEGGESTGEGGMGPGSGGSSGRGGSSGNGGNGAGTAGTGGAGVSCGSNPDDGEPCTGGPGVCPNDSSCICTAPPNGMVQCQ